MNILVTGGAGYIGSHVVLELIDQGYSVIVYDDLSTGNLNNIDPKATFINGSLTNNKKLNDVFKNNIDAVIHLAAFKAAGESMVDPSKYIENNLIGSFNLIKNCEKHNVKKIVFSSSASVYGEPNYLPIDENHNTNPINYYGLTKLQIEENLVWYHKLKKINFVSLRYFNASGYDNKQRILHAEKNNHNLIPEIMNSLIEKNKVVKVFGNDYNTPDGTAIRDYIHVTDLANAHILALDYLNNYKKKIIVNLGAKKGTSVLDIIKLSQRISGKKVNFIYCKRRIGDPRELIADYNKAKKILSWRPRFSKIENIIKSSWDIYKLKKND